MVPRSLALVASKKAPILFAANARRVGYIRRGAFKQISTEV
jgi:hypothetical protein